MSRFFKSPSKTLSTIYNTLVPIVNRLIFCTSSNTDRFSWHAISPLSLESNIRLAIIARDFCKFEAAIQKMLSYSSLCVFTNLAAVCVLPQPPIAEITTVDDWLSFSSISLMTPCLPWKFLTGSRTSQCIGSSNINNRKKIDINFQQSKI